MKIPVLNQIRRFIRRICRKYRGSGVFSRRYNPSAKDEGLCRWTEGSPLGEPCFVLNILIDFSCCSRMILIFRCYPATRIIGGFDGLFTKTFARKESDKAQRVYSISTRHHFIRYRSQCVCPVSPRSATKTTADRCIALRDGYDGSGRAEFARRRSEASGRLPALTAAPVSGDFSVSFSRRASVRIRNKRSNGHRTHRDQPRSGEQRHVFCCRRVCNENDSTNAFLLNQNPCMSISIFFVL